MEGAGAGRLKSSVPVLLSEEGLDDLLSYYMRQEAFAFDVETQGPNKLDPLSNDVAWLSMATNGRADVIPMGHRNGELVQYRAAILSSGRKRLDEGLHIRPGDLSRSDRHRRPIFSDPPAQLSRSLVFDRLRPLFLSPDIIKVAHNYKFDAISISKYLGQLPVPPFSDTSVLESIIDSRLQRQHLRLEKCIKRRIGFDMEKGLAEDITLHSFNDTAKYSFLDAKMTWLLWKAQQELISSENLEHLVRLEMDVLEALIGMRIRGTRVDRGTLIVLRDEFEVKAEQAKQEAFKLAGRTFSFSKTKDKIEVLYADPPVGRGLTPKKFTEKTGTPSTDAESLAHHSRDPLVKQMLVVAEHEKLLSTYVYPYLGTDNKPSLLRDGKVHTNFNQIGAETGRMSSSQPNLQNIPSRGQYGKRIRGLFIADPEHDLVVGDYSQIEPRIIASLSGDDLMIDTYKQGGDLYQAVADELQITRAAGKELVLSMAYGVGPDKLSVRIGLTVTKAKELLSSFSEQFPDVERLRSKVIRTAKRRKPVPYVTTVVGRRRYIPELRSTDSRNYYAGERRAFNTLIQGSAADIMKIALVRAHQMLPEGSGLLLTVHDELVAQAPKESSEAVASILKEAMEGVSIPAIRVPLTSDVKIGHNWAEAH